MQVQDSISIAATSVNTNVLVGTMLERMPFNGRISFGLVASATGLILDVYTGQDVITENNTPSIANRFPINPDDFTLNDVAAYNEQVKIRCRNITGGALTLFFSVIAEPI